MLRQSYTFNFYNGCFLKMKWTKRTKAEIIVLYQDPSSARKGWVGAPYAPKILALPERGALPLARIFWRIRPQCPEGPPK